MVGYPVRWRWFPKGPRRGVHREWFVARALAINLWQDHFAVPRGRLPYVYASRRMSALYHARTYPWGIVLSERAYRKVGHARRYRWLKGLLLHELLHWAGYPHNAAFYRYAKALGTW